MTLPVSRPATTAAVQQDVNSSITGTAAKALEQHINQLLLQVSPSPESLAKRHRVVDYVQRLVQNHFRGIGYEVCPVPPSHAASASKPVPCSHSWSERQYV